MAGTKGKSGSKAGKSNNPNGRPKGSTNKIQANVKEKIVRFIVDDFEAFTLEIKELDPASRVKAKIELIKLVVPKPLNDEEDKDRMVRNEFVDLLFGRKKVEE